MLRIAPKDQASLKPKAFAGKETPEEEALEPEAEESEPDEVEPVSQDLAEAPQEMDDELASYPSHQLSQLIVHYQPPDLGPFRCDHCMNWMGDGQCRFVEGEIAPEGLCSIYESIGQEGGLEEVPDAALAPSINKEIDLDDVDA